MTELDIGARLRHLRIDKKLSQRALARRASVTNATISLIEANKVNPSVGALKRILDGIPVSLADFFAMDISGPDQYFHAAKDLVQIGKGKISYRQVGTRLRSLQMLKERYEAGADTGRVLLTHEGEEAGIILSGQLEITIDGHRRTLRVGEAYLFDSRLPHRFRNTGRQACEVISACTPPTF